MANTPPGLNSIRRPRDLPDALAERRRAAAAIRAQLHVNSAYQGMEEAKQKILRGYLDAIRIMEHDTTLYWGSRDFCALLQGAHEGYPLEEHQHVPIPDEIAPRGLLFLSEPIVTDETRILMITWDRSLPALILWEGDDQGESEGPFVLYDESGKMFPYALPFARIAGAAWSLLQQRDLVEQATVRRELRSKKAKRRTQGRQPEPVTIVNLRRSTPTGVPASGERKYHHRWVVSGHWRSQPCGPGRQDRRRIYVPPHVKGPEGAPMLETTKIYRW